MKLVGTLVLAIVALLGGCRSGEDLPAPGKLARPPEFSFEDTARLLEERDIHLTRMEERPGLLSREGFEEILRRRMRQHPTWEVVSVHLAEVDMPNPHFEIYDQPTYVVEITGPSTGNCFDFHLAATGRYEGGACFYPPRS